MVVRNSYFHLNSKKLRKASEAVTERPVYSLKGVSDYEKTTKDQIYSAGIMSFHWTHLRSGIQATTWPRL